MAAPPLSPYHDALPGALPLPPPSNPRQQGFGAPGPTHVPYAGAQLTSMPTSMSGARPSKGGIVFVIIGLSAVIAVLILVILWALVLR